MKNFLVIPAFYKGTSFEDIVNSINICLKGSELPVELIGLTSAFHNNLLSDTLEDNCFFEVQQDIISDLIAKINSPSRILFLDMFFPGLDLVKYYFEKNKITVKMGALLHGGVFLDSDLLSPMKWLSNAERGYFDMFDRIYSPSEFLKSKCADEYKVKIKVFPWGLDQLMLQPIANGKKNLDVVFPHRIAADKGIDDLLAISKALADTGFYVTVPQSSEDRISGEFRSALASRKNIHLIFGQNEKEHIHTLASAKVVLSCARQENFGYAVHKSIWSGCIPVLPTGLCYDEFIETDYLYSDVPQAVDLIAKYLQDSAYWNTKHIFKNVNQFTFSNLLTDFYE